MPTRALRSRGVTTQALSYASVTLAAPAAWSTPLGLTGWPGSAPAMVEDTSTGAHCVITNAAGWVRGRSRAVFRIKFTSRIAVKMGTGGKYAVMNSTGAVSNVVAGISAFMYSDGAAGFYCVLDNPDQTTSTMELYIDNPANTDSYTGDGASGVDFISAALYLVK